MAGQHEPIGPYRILAKLGEGGMGVVYEAEDTRLGRRVALKFLPGAGASPEAAARFEREARLLSSLNHPNICTIHDIGTVADTDGERRYLVMELLAGESLRNRIHGQPLPIDVVIEIGAAIADALDAAHEQGIVHRDIKPANIFITRRGQAKLLDFGVAKPGDAGSQHDETRALAEQLTVPGTTVGSIHYMSPEQARGQEIDGRSDIFSLGLVIYEMATGRQAFSGPTSAVVYEAILNRQPAPASQLNSDVPPDLDRIISRSLEKDPQLRYQTAGDLVAELRRLRRDTDARRAGSSGAEPVAASDAAPASTVIGAAPSGTPQPLATAATGSAMVTPPSPSAVAQTTRWPRWALFGLAAVLVIGIAGFWLWSSARTPAFTERDLILVADFANSTGDAVFDDALKQAVSVQLQQTPFVTLLADQQVQSTLALMQRQPDAAVVGAVARELCQRAGARATVEGSIAALGSSYVIALGVHDCQTGAAIAQDQKQADNKEGVLKAVGAAVTTLRERLGESLASIEKNDVPAAATTASLEALRAYGQGLKIRATKSDEASIPFFQQALEKDPNFALAHAKLGVVYSNVGRAADARASFRKAFDRRDKVSEYERLYIQWAHYTRGEPDDTQAKQALDLLTTQYPRDFAARHNLGLYLSNKGQLEEAAAQYTVAHELAPNEPLPASNLSAVLFNLGRYEEAMKYADIAMTLRPSGNVAVSRWVRAHVQFDPREAMFKEAAVKYASPEVILQNEMSMAVWDGRWNDYLAGYRSLVELFSTAKREQALASLELNHSINASVFEGGPTIDALKRAAAAQNAPPAFVQQAALSLAMMGDFSALRREMARIDRQEGAAAGASPSPLLVFCRAFLLGADKKTDEALALLRPIATADVRQAATFMMIGQVQEWGGLTEDAIASYRRVVDARAALGMNYNVAMARLALGRLLLAKGDRAGADEQFDVLARQWERADEAFVPVLELKRIRTAGPTANR